MNLYLAIPVLSEYKNLPRLIRCLEKQTCKNFTAVFCVNQFDSWWGDPEKRTICEDNQRSIQYLNSVSTVDLTVIDRSSNGSGWKGKKGGVGWARKVAMDEVIKNALPEDVIISMDADTEYPENYLAAMLKSFSENNEALGLSVPYYHKLTNKINDRLILRYEIYMRYYILNLLRINSPYAFTALGSALAVTVKAYRKVGGITPVKSGEDFYFLQKLAKSGKLLIWTDTLAYPSSRFSDRVYFGTGPALIKGKRGDWFSYPLYKYDLFDHVKNTYEKFPCLFKNDLPTPMDNFLKDVFNTNDLWSRLRKNYTDRDNFIKACMIKVDGLRILQYLKYSQKRPDSGDRFDAISLSNDLQKLVDLSILTTDITNMIENMPLSVLSKLRDILFNKEQQLRKQIILTGL